MEDDGDGEGAAVMSEVPAQSLCRLSAALPPFSQLGSETTAMLMPLVRGEAPAQAVELTAAIVVQIWLVFCGTVKQARSLPTPAAWVSTWCSVHLLWARHRRGRRPRS